MKTNRFGWMAIAIAIAVSPALAEEPFIYPSKGQSQERQQKDKSECHFWSVDQSGFDPMNPPPAPAQNTATTTQGGVVKGGARGAAMGAVGGAIAGDAGKGAAAGAAIGAMAGGMRRADAYRQQGVSNRSAQQQYDGQIATGRSSYNRAFAACIEGRGYTIK